MSEHALPAAPQSVPPPVAPPGLVRALHVWHRIECWIAVLSFGFIAAVLVIDVLGREFYGPVMTLLGVKVGATGLFGSQKLAVFALVIGSFCGIGIATATGVHLVPRVAFGWLPARWSPHVDRLADLLTGTFLLVVTYYACLFVIGSKNSGVLAAVINVSAWPIQMAIPLGILSAAVRYFNFAMWPAVRPAAPEFQE